MMEYVGANQQATSWYTTTDFERARDAVRARMGELRKQGLVKAEMADGLYITRFLSAYIRTGREYGVDLASNNMLTYRTLIREYDPGMSSADVSRFLMELFELSKLGRIPLSILRPWTYDAPAPSSLNPLEAAKGMVGDIYSRGETTWQNSLNKILVAAVIGVAAYAYFTQLPSAPLRYGR